MSYHFVLRLKLLHAQFLSGKFLVAFSGYFSQGDKSLRQQHGWKWEAPKGSLGKEEIPKNGPKEVPETICSGWPSPESQVRLPTPWTALVSL